MIAVIVILLGLTSVFAHNEDFSEAKKLVDANTSCGSLSDEQLEQIGDYYMEQMHPGEAHELMDKMHGGEGSAQLKQMHIFMAKRLYCGDDSSGYDEMMGSGWGKSGNNTYGGMMGGGMMNMMSGGMIGWGNGYGIMGGWNYGWSLWSILWTVLMVGLVVLVILLIIKLIKSIQ